MALFDVTEATDFFRNGGKAHGQMMIFRRQRGQHIAEHGFIVSDQAPLSAALKRSAKGVKGSTPQEFELRQEPKCGEKPRPKIHFTRQARRLVAARQEWRRQMKLEAEVFAGERAGNLVDERARGVKPR